MTASLYAKAPLFGRGYSNRFGTLVSRVKFRLVVKRHEAAWL